MASPPHFWYSLLSFILAGYPAQHPSSKPVPNHFSEVKPTEDFTTAEALVLIVGYYRQALFFFVVTRYGCVLTLGDEIARVVSSLALALAFRC
jgi:hypothetical protein